MPERVVARSLASRSSGSRMNPTAISTRGSRALWAASHASNVLSLVPALKTTQHANRSTNRSTSAGACNGKNRSRRVTLGMCARRLGRQLLADIAERLRDQLPSLRVEDASAHGRNRPARNRLTAPREQRDAVAGVNEVGAGGQIDRAAKATAGYF